MYLQEITLDFNTYYDLVRKSTNEIRNLKIYSDVFGNINLCHILCIDKKGDNTSEWFNNYASLLKELNDCAGLGVSIRKLVEDDFNHLFQKNAVLSISSDKQDISSICKDIAKKTPFKILIKDAEEKYDDLIQLNLSELIDGIIPKSTCILLKRDKNVDFARNQNTCDLTFLHPYLYYSNNLEIVDKYFLKEKYHLKILEKLISYMKNPIKVFIRTQFSDATDKSVTEIKNSVNESYGRELLQIKFQKDAHPRRIISDYALIELTNTLDALFYSNGKLLTKSDIQFNIRLKQ